MKFKSRYFGIIGIVVLVYILFTIDLPRVFTILRSTNIYYLIIAVLVNPVVILLLTIRWKYIIRIIGGDIKFRSCLLLRLKGVFLGNITPGRIGDLYRAKHLSEEGNLDLAKSFSSVIIDRILDIFALIFLNIVGLYLLMYIFEVKAFLIESILFSLLILICLFFIVKKNLMRKLLRPLYKIFVPSDAKEKVVIHFYEFYNGLAKMKGKNYLLSFLVSIFVWIITYLGIYLLALSLDISVSLIFIIAMAPVASFLSALPISVGGLGTREAIYVFFLSSIDIEPEYAVALALMVFIFLNLIYLPFGIATYLVSGDKK